MDLIHHHDTEFARWPVHLPGLLPDDSVGPGQTQELQKGVPPVPKRQEGHRPFPHLNHALSLTHSLFPGNILFCTACNVHEWILFA